MMKFLRVSVSAVALSAFALAPVLTVMTADYAYANNGKGGGNGGGKGNGGKGNGGDKGNAGNGNGGGKSADNGNNGRGGDKAAKDQKSRSAKAGNGDKSRNAGKGFGRAVQDDFKSFSRSLKKNGLGGLFAGQKKEPAVAKASRSYSAPKTSNRPPSRRATYRADLMHPTNLGKLNGAINSSPRAKQAHIENGQYMKGSGPVSLAAGLAVADYGFSDVMGPDNTLSAKEVKDIDAAFKVRDTSSLTLDDAETILANPGPQDPATVAEAQTVKDAYDLTKDDEGADIDRPAVEQVAAAGAVLDAQDGLLGHFKGGFSEDETLAAAQQQEVLGAVRAANPDPAMVGTSLEVYGVRQAEEHEESTNEDNLTNDGELGGDGEDVTTDAEAGEVSDKTIEEEIVING